MGHTARNASAREVRLFAHARTSRGRLFEILRSFPRWVREKPAQNDIEVDCFKVFTFFTSSLTRTKKVFSIFALKYYSLSGFF